MRSSLGKVKGAAALTDASTNIPTSRLSGCQFLIAISPDVEHRQKSVHEFIQLRRLAGRKPQMASNWTAISLLPTSSSGRLRRRRPKRIALPIAPIEPLSPIAPQDRIPVAQSSPVSNSPANRLKVSPSVY